MNDDTPPENVMPVLMDTDGTIHARLSVHAPSSTSNRQATACVPDISPDNGGSAAAQVRQETKKQRQARLLREKNRRNQKKFRERQRVRFHRDLNDSQQLFMPHCVLQKTPQWNAPAYLGVMHVPLLFLRDRYYVFLRG